MTITSHPMTLWACSMSFSVIRMTKMMDAVGLPVKKPPDQSIIMWHFDIEYLDEPATLHGQHEHVGESKTYVVSNIPDNFWFDGNVLNELRITIDQQKQIEHNQTAIDTNYLEFCKLVTNKMDRKL